VQPDLAGLQVTESLTLKKFDGDQQTDDQLIEIVTIHDGLITGVISMAEDANKQAAEKVAAAGYRIMTVQQTKSTFTVTLQTDTTEAIGKGSSFPAAVDAALEEAK
jgi:hypothetical protein